MSTKEVRGKYLFVKGGTGMGSHEEFYFSLSGSNVTIERDDGGNVDSVYIEKSGYSQTVGAAEMKPSRDEFITKLMSALGITGATAGRRTRKTH